MQNHSVSGLLVKFIENSTEACPFSERSLTNRVDTRENKKKKNLRTALFWVITQQTVVISDRHFGTIFFIFVV